MWSDALFLAGRILFGGYYVMNGYQHFAHLKMLVPYARSKGVPFPAAGVVVTGLMMLFGGLSFLLGLYPVVGVALIVLFLVPTTVMMHDFWAAPQDQKMSQTVNFMKNVALIGATLMLLAIPMPWALSLF